MLFLLKRTWPSALAALAVLVALGTGLRCLVPAPTPFDFSPVNLAIGVAVFAAVLASDGFVHGLLLRFGDRYWQRYQELAAVFRGQKTPAMLAGALMAGLGEELVFRGLSTDLIYLMSGAVVFGALHHIRRSIWLFTVWSVWEGMLFAVALMLTGSLCVTMTAHFLHDLAGLLVFRHVNRRFNTAHGERGG